MAPTFKYAAMSRRAALSAAALASMAVLAGCSGGGAGGEVAGDMAQGAPEGAKVTVVEYASITCGHSGAPGAQDLRPRYSVNCGVLSACARPPRACGASGRGCRATRLAAFWR